MIRFRSVREPTDRLWERGDRLELCVVVQPRREANGNPAFSSDPSPVPVVVIGAGPAGLTAAYQLVKAGRPVVVLEGDDVVGGISRTVEREGWRFDIGGHRFFTKVQAVEDLWHEILPDEDFLRRPRMSRIYYDGKFFDYPLRAMNALRNLGVIEATMCVLSYAWARVRPPGTWTRTKVGPPRGSVGGSTGPSSRPTPRRSGGCRAASSRRTSPLSVSRPSLWARRFATPSSPVREARR